MAVAILLVAGGAWAGARRIQPQQYQLQATLTDPDGLGGDLLGYTVAMSANGRTAVIAAPANGQVTPGKVLIFSRAGSSWSKTAELVPNDPTGAHFFGGALAVNANGTTVLASALTNNNARGAVFVFHRSGSVWSQEAELSASDGVQLGYFGGGSYLGNAVSLDAIGNTALIGALRTSSGVGAAYLFQRTGAGWVERNELFASDGVATDAFGYSVALSGDGGTALVGAEYRANGTGAAYVFSRGDSGWGQDAILTASDGLADDRFGSSVALSFHGETALIGSPQSGSHGLYPLRNPSAYVYSRVGSTWGPQAELVEPSLDSEYGTSVALSAWGDVALIGDFLFVRTASQWDQGTELTAPAPKGSYLGLSVGLDAAGNTAVIGAPFIPGPPWGVAYIFGLPFTSAIF